MSDTETQEFISETPRLKELQNKFNKLRFLYIPAVILLIGFLLSFFIFNPWVSIVGLIISMYVFAEIYTIIKVSIYSKYKDEFKKYGFKLQVTNTKIKSMFLPLAYAPVFFIGKCLNHIFMNSKLKDYKFIVILVSIAAAVFLAIKGHFWWFRGNEKLAIRMLGDSKYVDTVFVKEDKKEEIKKTRKAKNKK